MSLMSDEHPSVQQFVDLTLRVDAQEKILSNILLAYMELALGVELLMGRIVGAMDSDEGRKFAVDALEMREKMIAFLRQASEQEDESGFNFDTSADSFFAEHLRDAAVPDEA